MYEIISEGLKSKADIVYFRTDSIYNDTGKQAYRHENYNQLIDTYLMNLKSASNLNGNLNCSKELEHYAS